MRRLIVLAVLGCALAALTPVVLGEEAASEASTGGQTILVKLDHFTGDLHAVSMALKLGVSFEHNDADAILFLNLEAVRLADKRHPVDLHWGQSATTVGELYETFVNKGGEVLVCPHCAKAVGLRTDDLRKGARIGTDADVTAAFMKATKIVTY